MRLAPLHRLALLACLLLAPLTAWAQPVTVFAAASLTDAMKDVNGAPVNVFASADEKWMTYLVGKNLIATDTRKDLLGNDLVLVVPATHPQHVTIGPGFDLAKLLGPNGRLAVGDPAHVPAGIYAEQALRKLGLWDSVSPRLARADDVRSALLLVERGEAPAGIVYGTDAAVSKAVMVAGTFPANSHDPVSYPFAVVKAGDTQAARELMTFLSGPEAQAIFVKRGFKVE